MRKYSFRGDNPFIENHAQTFAGGRGDSGTLRSTKSEESLTSLHNVEGKNSLKLYSAISSLTTKG